jgi:hypothetical protein
MEETGFPVAIAAATPGLEKISLSSDLSFLGSEDPSLDRPPDSGDDLVRSRFPPSA